MFKLAAVKKVRWPVTVLIPQDGGKVQKAEFDVELEILDQKEHDELVTSLGGDLLKRVVTGWQRVKGEDGQDDVPFSEASKEQMLGINYVRVGLLKAYYEASQGRKAERKN